jgi:hypothetical protein
MQIVKKHFCLLVTMFFVQKNWATEFFHYFKNKIARVKTMKNNRSVNRFFKIREQPLFLCKYYITICSRPQNVDQLRYPYVSWFIEKTIKAFNTKSERFKNIYVQEKSFHTIQKLDFFICSNHQIITDTNDHNDICIIWKSFLKEYKKEYLRDIHFVDFSKKCKKSEIQIDACMNWQCKQKNSLHLILNEINNITSENLGAFKYDYIAKSLKKLSKVYLENIKDSDQKGPTVNLTDLLNKIESNNQADLSTFVTQWEIIFRKSLQFTCFNDIL